MTRRDSRSAGSRRERPFWYMRRNPDQLRAEVDEELRVHLEMRTDELVAHGMSRDEARDEALRRFGDLEYTRRYCRDQDERKEGRMRWSLFLEELRQDVRYSVRKLARTPGFTSVAVLTLAFGIGANTAIFSIINAVLLRPVATPEPERLVVIREDLPRLNLMNTELAPPEVIDLAARTDVFENVAAYRPAAWNLTGSGAPVRMDGAITLGDFFETFRVQAHLGRLYTAENSTTREHDVVVLSYGAWLQHTGGDTSIVGRTIQLDGQPRQVVGVLPRGFHYPRNAQIYQPFPLTPEARQRRGTLSMIALARLRPGVTHAQLASQLEVEAARWNEQYHRGSVVMKVLYAVPFAEYLAGRLRVVLLVLMGAVVFVLLIACANVGSLQLARTAARTREVALRAALGAGRGRISRQLLVESAVLAVLGGALGLWLGTFTLDLLARWDPASSRPSIPMRLDGTVLAFTALVSMVAAVAFGTLPALRATRVDLQRVLRDASRGASGSLGRSRLLHGSVVVQIALALVLLIGSGLMIRSLGRLLETDIGFAPSRVVAAQVSLPPSKYNNVPRQSAFYDAVLERLRGMPGMDAAAIAWALPFSDQRGDSSPFEIVGRPAQPNEPERHAEYRVVGGDYFRAMGIPLLRGRGFDVADDMGDPSSRVVLIDEHFADRFFPGQDAIGRQIRHGRGLATIIGVVGSIDHTQIGEPRKAVSYYHFRQTWSGLMAIVVRSSLDAATSGAMIRTGVREVDAELPVYDIATMEQRVRRSLGDRRLAVGALGVFAGLSLLLAMLGVYGVMRYSTNQRTQEIGIRMALGASAAEVVGMVVREGMLMAGIGILIGIGAALALTRLMEGILFGVGARDPVTFAAVTALVVAVALLATVLPARHAARVEPVLALRAE
jgi:putative ABC transport system permease protein